MIAYKLAAVLHQPIAAVDPQVADKLGEVLTKALHQDQVAVTVISYVLLGVIVALVALAWWAVHVHARLAVGHERMEALKAIEVAVDRNLSICESVLRLQTFLLTNCSKCNPEVADELLRESQNHVSGVKRQHKVHTEP